MPVSPRAAKSIIRLSQSLDEIARGKGVSNEVIEQDYFNSMMQAYKFVSAYSGVLNAAAVDNTYGGDKYKALDAVITTTRTQFDGQRENISAGIEMIGSGKLNSKVLERFTDRWTFMRHTLETCIQKYHENHTS
jgi:hypothetical protein